MYGKLNREISMWLGDVPPLLAALQRTWPPRKPESFTLEEALISPYGGWQPAGQASGLEIIETKKKRIYTGDEDGDWEKVALINDDDIKTDSNGRKIYEYWNGTQLRELVLVDENGNSLWQIDEDLDTATEVAREVRGDVEVTLYAGKYDNALLERPLREPMFGRVYWLPKDVYDIDAAYRYIAAHQTT
jgi:hypothetical protein